MIPRIKKTQVVDPLVVQYLECLEKTGFGGDIETSYGARLTMATDNSVYQLLPQAVLFPRDAHDVGLALKTAARDKFKNIQFSARGGGTGTNGQSLTPGIVCDMSRYLHRVLEVNRAEGWARVQAGVIKDQLNDALRPHDLFFSPDLSTSNRATIGGMVNTDASGQGSLQYGKTSDHVLALKGVFASGEDFSVAPVSVSKAEAFSKGKGTLAAVYRQILVTCGEHGRLIDSRFPKLNRFLTGYDLKHVYSEAEQILDLTRILCGSEGSLAVVTEVKLNLTPIPGHRTLINVKYKSFDDALRNAPFLVEAQALSVETIDSKVLNLAKDDLAWHSVESLLKEVPGQEMQGVNIVEYADNDASEQLQKTRALTDRLDQLIAENQAGVIGYQKTDDLQSINRIYGMRKKAVGLLGNSPGSKKPIAFAEDTCVPPQKLADFIGEFRTLLDDHHLQYGMFGHVDTGVLHVRPAMDMCDPEQERLLRQISDHVVALTVKYGGLMWGEHGKGFRSEYGPEFFGEQLFNELRKIKTAFDPENKMNPGKICTPFGSDATLVSVDAVKRGTFDRKIAPETRASYELAMNCNGNGLCFNYDTSSPMCPSVKMSRDRQHSPKGRAGLMREWLRLVGQAGADVLAEEKSLRLGRQPLTNLLKKARNSWRRDVQEEYDYSHEVMSAMKGCLACKACTSQCPIRVDVPSFRARFFQLYYSRYLRPVRDYLIGSSERSSPLMARFPQMINFFLAHPLLKRGMAKMIGMEDAPRLSVPTLKQSLLDHCALGFDLQSLQMTSPKQRQEMVIIVQDAFTSFYDADVVSDLIKLVALLGKKPVILPFRPNGKAEHVKGFLRAFAATAKDSASYLAQVHQLNIPMIGLDPALVLCYRDEYKEILGEDLPDFQVMLFQEWIKPHLHEFVPLKERPATDFVLFAHCTEKTALPTTHQDWMAIFDYFNISLRPEEVGCCGMAGTYGHESPNVESSKGIYKLSWADPMNDLTVEQVLVTGYSCRSQVSRMENFKPQHPVQALLSALS